MKKFYLPLLTVICILCVIGCEHPQTPINPQNPPDSTTMGQDTEEPVKQEAEFKNENGTMVITKAGTISKEDFQKFIKDDSLTVAGPLTEENYELIGQLSITKLDLSGATDIPGGYTQVTMSPEGVIRQNNNVIPLNFRGNTKLETVILPDTAEVLPAAAFSECSNLKSFTGKGIKIVGYCAFWGTAVETIELPAAEEIGYSAFSNCKNLKIVSLPKAKKLYNDILYNNHSPLDITITLPCTVEVTPGADLKPSEPQDLSTTFRGFKTENASLVLFGAPESEITDKEWQGHTWKSIAVR